MTILWVLRHTGFARNYEPVLRQLAASGHRIEVVYELGRNKFGEDVILQRLAAESPRITWGRAPERVDTLWTMLATAVRTVQDYARYHGPEYRDAPLLRERAEKFLPASILWIVKLVAALGGGGRWLLRQVCAAVEQALPPAPEVVSLLRERQPDVLIVTPLVDFGSQQVDYLKAARRIGIPSALGVASWDNLTNKGLIKWTPDRVFVWNNAQKIEAVDLHGVPADRVVVTGAQIFDHWFDWQPSRTREEFCTQMQLDPSRPFVLYLGSSPFLAPDEAGYVEGWIAAIRRHPALAGVGVLMRPHPKNTRQWVGKTLQQFGNASIWPPPGADPFSPQFKHDFFDSLYHCGVVVGVNTSAQIEAGIVGRAVCTVRASDFAHSQDGTLHFKHLAGEGGLLYVAADIEEHCVQLADVIAGRADVAGRSRRFVESFVRPYGVGVPATPAVVAAIESLGRLAGPPAPAPAWAPAMRAAGYVPALAVRALWETANRPWRTLPLRLIVSLCVAIAAAGYRIPAAVRRSFSHGRERLRRSGRRVARISWVAWYESRQSIRKWTARRRKQGRQWRRRIGGKVRAVPKPR